MKKLSLLCLLLLFWVLPVSTALAADIVDSGTCGAEGTNLTWTLDSDGVLTISGSGAMADYRSGSSPWYSQRANIITAVIADGITGIGKYAFDQCRGLTGVTIPDSVIRIGNNAFCQCNGLTRVTVGSGVTSIGKSAFWGCGSLTDVYISDLTAWCNIDFADAAANPLSGNLYLDGVLLTELVIPDGVTGIRNHAFSHCSSLTSVTLPEGVTSIGSAAFRSCSSLVSIAIPEGVTSIGSNAFSSCSSLTGVAVPDSVTSIGSSAFQSCKSLTGISIPAGVSVIEKSVFANCSALSDVTIPEGVTTIGDSAFYACGNLIAVTLPAGVTGIGASAFAYCSRLSDVTIPAGLTSLGASAFDSCAALTGVSLPGSIGAVSARAFNGCLSLESVTLAGGVTAIGESAFADCSVLSEVTIPASVTDIGALAFSNCEQLAQVYYMGAPDQWDAITVGIENQPLLDADLHYGLEITSQPVDYTGKAGSAIRFTMGASGDGLTYQWYFRRAGETDFNKSTVAAATQAAFTMTMADKYDGWQYYCLLRDSHGNSLRSATVTIHKAADLAVITQPADYYGAAGNTIRFTVTAGGDGLTYQWYFKRTGETVFNKSTLSSGVKKTYYMKMADKYDGWQYYCIVTDTYGDSIQSDTVTVHKVDPPVITSQPVDFRGPAGTTLRFETAASGEDLTYQWYYKKPGAASFTKSTLASGATAEYRMTLKERHDGWQYYCRIKDKYGNIVKTDTVTVHLQHRLQLTSQPVNYTGPVGSTIRFTVGASGDGLAYQWYYKKTGAASFTKSTLASGATAEYRMTLKERHDSWQYYCIVSDAYGSKLRSNTVTVRVSADNELRIVKQPADFEGAVGDTAKFTVKASGDGLKYQWYYKKTGATSFVKSTLSSGTKATYSMTIAERHLGWQYYCIVTDAAGNSLRTNTVTIYVE